MILHKVRELTLEYTSWQTKPLELAKRFLFHYYLQKKKQVRN